MVDVMLILVVAISIVAPLVATGAIVWRFVIPLYKRSAEARAIMATGEPAHARVVQIALTGTSVNDHPEVRMTLDVYPQSRPPYRTEHVGVFSLLAIPRIQPGCALDVRFDRADPMKVAVVGT